jgi:hypothetical protein
MLSLDSKIIDRNDIVMASFGIISNGGSFEIIDYTGEIREWAESLKLNSKTKVNIFLNDTISGKSTQVGEFFATKWNYDNNKATASTVKVMSEYSTVTRRVNAITQTVINIGEATDKAIAEKIIHDNSGACILVSFAVDSVSFSSGTATLDISSYVPENYTLVSCFAQITNLTGVVISSVTIEGSNVKLTGLKISNGGTHSGTVSRVRCLGICQKIEGEEV